MDPREWFMFFHFVGFGLIITMLVGSWLLHKQYNAASDYGTKLTVLNSMRLIGLLSPFTILLLLITGIGNMVIRDLGFTTEMWLTVKICLFLIAAVNGVIFGIRSKKRGMLVGQLAKGGAPAEAEKTLAGMDRFTLLFLIVQTVLSLSILVLAVWKPGTSRGA
jgi:hypothetical protein